MTPRQRNNERGQMALMAAITMVVVLGFAALAIDLGVAAHTKRNAQNDADAMALAGARDLPDAIVAEDSAEQWGVKNLVDMAEVEDIWFGTTCSEDSVDGTVSVRLKREQGSFFAGVLGIDSQELNVCATARSAPAMAGNGLLPLGFLDENPNIAGVCYMRETDGTERADLWGNQCDIKIENPSGTWTAGNTGGLALDPTELIPGNYNTTCVGDADGASEYRDNIAEGSECLYAIEDEVKPKGGSVTGPTHQGFSQRLQGNYDTIEQVFGTPDSGGCVQQRGHAEPAFRGDSGGAHSAGRIRYVPELHDRRVRDRLHHGYGHHGRRGERAHDGNRDPDEVSNLREWH